MALACASPCVFLIGKATRVVETLRSLEVDVNDDVEFAMKAAPRRTPCVLLKASMQLPSQTFCLKNVQWRRIQPSLTLAALQSFSTVSSLNREDGNHTELTL